MKILVTGVNGQLGYDVVRELQKRGHEPIGVDIEEMDITRKAEVEKVWEKVQPDGVIHCAAYTAVDRAEDEEELCREVNAAGTRNIAEVCKKNHGVMMYISTDYVFSGEGEKPWRPEDEKNPVSVYGLTKLEGERAVTSLLDEYFIVRISWVFGENGKNFVDTMLRLGKEKEAVSVVCDQIGSPTYTYDLARLLVDMMETKAYGIYHASNEGVCSWYEFAVEIFKWAGMDVRVEPIKSSEFTAKAKRPMNSRMSKAKLTENGFQLLPTWQDAVKRYIRR